MKEMISVIVSFESSPNINLFMERIEVYCQLF